MVTRKPRLFLTQQAADVLRAAAKGSTEREQGGILLGWRLDDGIHVQEVVAVRNADAGPAHYKRSQRAAQAALDARLRLHGDGPLGYVGEWHTHPQPVPPSATDRATMRVMALRNRRPVALIVASRRPGAEPDLHGLISADASLPARAARPFTCVKPVLPRPG